MRKVNKNQAAQIQGKNFSNDSFYHVVVDAEGDMVISEEEVNHTTNPAFDFVKSLPKKDWKDPFLKVSGGTVKI